MNKDGGPRLIRTWRRIAPDLATASTRCFEALLQKSTKSEDLSPGKSDALERIPFQ